MWYLAWNSWKKCNYSKEKHNCISKINNKSTWKGFNYPLINGLQIAASRFDPARHTQFSTFAFGCIRITLANYCKRECPVKERLSQEEYNEHFPEKTAAPLQKLIRQQEIAVLIKAIKKSYKSNSEDFRILILYMLRFTQKDIVFLLNHIFSEEN